MLLVLMSLALQCEVYAVEVYEAAYERPQVLALAVPLACVCALQDIHVYAHSNHVY